MTSGNSSPPLTTLTTNTNTNTNYTRRHHRKRASPPTQDKLVLVFIAASTIFAVISLSPFLLGHFPDIHSDWRTKHHPRDVDERKSNAASTRDNSRQQQSHGNSQIMDVNGDSDSSSAASAATPALIGAKRGTITCPSADASDVHMDELLYWNDPQGKFDVEFVSPFIAKQYQSTPKQQQEFNQTQQRSNRRRQYVTFEPDRGGWNNIRMAMEIIFVFAAVTGRTLVLPPDTPFYLLGNKEGDRGRKHHGFADFMNLDKMELRREVEIVTMKEFLEREAGFADGDSSHQQDSGEKLLTIPTGKLGDKIIQSAEQCYYIAKSDRPCEAIYRFLKDSAYVPELQAARDCLIFDVPSYNLRNKDPSVTDEEQLSVMSREKKRKVHEFCDKRNPIFFGGELASAPLIHFHSGDKYHRLLNHFYTFLLFTDPKVGNHYKRFVRDFLHYVDPIYCAAGKIIRLLEEEASMQAEAAGKKKSDTTPGFSSIHCRRGDFQYKKTKISAEEWLNATIGILHPEEIVYVATDEKDRSFFEPLEGQYNLRFLDEFSEAAGLDDLDPNYAGMIDTIVASRGRIFFGTWFSTFSGYINRMRGYHGFPGNTSYYGQPQHKLSMHKWANHEKVLTAREWPSGWFGIDSDIALDHF
ncbi:hypothetical protein HJC23_008734 [Cyclotella cryptica]|uniref:Fucosyltransferase n=1 Tax=Cyclotella cryptica TaxID=29204 RepID=A0ABD3PEH7_9STRA